MNYPWNGKRDVSSVVPEKRAQIVKSRLAKHDSRVNFLENKINYPVNPMFTHAGEKAWIFSSCRLRVRFRSQALLVVVEYPKRIFKRAKIIPYYVTVGSLRTELAAMGRCRIQGKIRSHWPRVIRTCIHRVYADVLKTGLRVMCRADGRYLIACERRLPPTTGV